MRQPKLNALRVFDAAARQLNFRLAAEELNVTQGAVAQTIRGLETDLRVTLFTRLARGVALTDVGAEYHRGIARGLLEIDQATKKLYSASNTITVSVPPSFASKWLVSRLPYFLEAHPGIDVKIVASEAVTDFDVHDVDLAVRQGPKPVGDGLTSIPLASGGLCIVCAPGFPDLHGPFEAISSFAELPLIQDGHRHWDRLFGVRDTTRSGSHLQFNQTTLAIDAAAQGQGYAIVPRLLAMDAISAGRLIEVAQVEEEQGQGFWLVYPKRERTKKPARTLFRAWVESECRDNF